MKLTRASQIDKVIFDLSKIETHTYQSNGTYGSKYINIVYNNNGKLKKVIIKKHITCVELTDIESAIAEISSKQTPNDQITRIERLVGCYSDIEIPEDDHIGIYDRCGGNADDAFNMGERSLATEIKKILYPHMYGDDED